MYYVLIPVYQAEAWLDACLASVFAQTEQNFHIILVDDGSTDGSGALCDAWAEKDPRVEVVHQANSGPYGARRAAIARCLKEAEGEDWAVFLDADDSLKPKALETIGAKAGDCDMVFIGEDQVWEGRVLRPFPADKAYVGTVEDKRRLYKIVFQDGWYNPLWKKAVKVRLLPKDPVEEYYPVRFGEDLLQSIPMYRECKKAVFLPDSLYNYAINPASATNALTYEKYRCSSLVLRECWEFLQSQKVWSDRDFAEYMDWLRLLTRFQVRLVAKFDTSRQNRIRRLKEIGEDDFYGKIIGTALRKDTLLWLMKKQNYAGVCLIGDGLRVAGNIRRKIKR